MTTLFIVEDDKDINAFDVLSADFNNSNQVMVDIDCTPEELQSFLFNLIDAGYYIVGVKSVSPSVFHVSISSSMAKPHVYLSLRQTSNNKE
jgi:hypothetical protein